MKKLILFFITILIFINSSIICFASPASADTDDSSLFSIIVDGFLSGIENLFIPDADFMQDMVDDIEYKFNKKFSGITSTINYLNNRFGKLKKYKDIDGIFKVKFPSNSFMHGISMDVLSSGRAVLVWVRFCTSGVAIIFTVFTCSRKIIKLVQV